MFPRKGRRNIVIDGVTWHYLVRGYVTVIAQNTETQEIVEWSKDVKPKWQIEITPKLVEEIIRTKGKPVGWEPTPKPKKYITTTLPYANSVPHIGHAFEFIIGDALARYFRGKLGDDNVHFNIGLDEHGKKIHDASVAAGKPTQQYLNELNDEWRKFCSLFDIQYNSFYRTSHSRHHEKAAKFWIQCQQQGLIYKKTYQGTYCVGCESFKLEKDLENGKCPDHPNLETQFVEEENYFFALTKFRKELLEWHEKELYLRPYSKRDELFKVIDEIQDISISRKRESVPWGVAVPGDGSQVMYVWFEALLNYILILGYYGDREEFDKYWNESVQIFGPDNLKFQAAIFQGLLSAAGVKHTGALLCHGTILDKHGKKMSKTVGNVIDPIDQLNKYGVDAVRYYALAGLQVYGNSGWDEEQLVRLYNAHLADNYGNLLTRVVHLINLRDKDEQYDDCNYTDYQKANRELFQLHFDAVRQLWDNYDITAALHKLNDILKSANLYITENAPWAKDAKNVEEVLSTLYWVLDQATLFYLPVIPHKGREAWQSLHNLKKEIVFPKITLVETVEK
jgi:methionyl-tRNA synthetase